MKVRHDYVTTSLSVVTKRRFRAAAVTAVVVAATAVAAGPPLNTVVAMKCRHDTNGLYRDGGTQTK